MSQRLITLTEEYKHKKDGLSEQQKAELENEIWFVYGTICGKRREERRIWFTSQFGGTQAEYDDRANLVNSGKEVEQLWRRLDKGMLRRTAVMLLREGKQRFHSENFNKNKTGEITLTEAIKGVLEEYDKIEADKIEAAKNAVPKKKAKKAKPDSGKSTSEDPANKSKKFFQSVRTLTDEFLKERLKEVDPYFAKEISEEYVDWIREGYDDLRKKVSKHRADAKKERVGKIGRTRFQNACEILAIRGTFGKPVDLMAAKRCKMQRVKQLHPDKNEGNRETEREFQSVVEAYDLIQEYMEQLGE